MPSVPPSAASSWEELTLNEVIKLLRAGKFAVPNFQRAFVWNGDLIKALMRSIFRDYYIGSLLLWEGTEDAEDLAGGTFDRLHCEPMYGFENEHNYRANWQWIILDGQQRLTAMHYAFFAPEVGIVRDEDFRDHPVRFYVRIDKFTMSDGRALDDEETFVVKVAVPESDEVVGHLFPLCLLSKEPTERAEWFSRYRAHWQARQDQHTKDGDDLLDKDKDLDKNEEELYRLGLLASEAKDHIEQSKAFQNHLDDSVLDYRVRYVELKRDLEVDRVRDIFTQVNKRGEQLDDFGLLNAVVTLNGFSPKMEISKLATQRLAGLESAELEAVIPRLMMLRAHPEHEIVLPANEYLTPGRSAPVAEHIDDGGEPKKVNRVLIKNDADGGSQDFKDRWNEAVGELTSGLSALDSGEQYGIPADYDDRHRPLIFGPFNAMLPVFCALLRDTANNVVAGKGPAPRTKILQWYWASVLMRRYGRTTEQDRLAANRDYREVSEWLVKDSKNPKKPGIVAAFLQEADPEFLDGAQYRSRIDGDDTLYRGLVSLMYSNAPRDLLSGIFERSVPYEDHYIFPPKWCETRGLEPRDYETIFNRILVSRDVADLCCDADGRNPMNFRRLTDRWGSRGERWEDEKKSDVLASHFITRDLLITLGRSPKTLNTADIREFWYCRGREILATIGKDIFNEQSLSLLAADRRWDKEIGKIETALRRVLVDLIIREEGLNVPLPAKLRRPDSSALSNTETEREYRQRLNSHFNKKVTLPTLWKTVVDAPRNSRQWHQVKQAFPPAQDQDAWKDRMQLDQKEFRTHMENVTKLRNAMHHYREEHLSRSARSTYENSVFRMQVYLGLRSSGNRAVGM